MIMDNNEPNIGSTLPDVPLRKPASSTDLYADTGLEEVKVTTASPIDKAPIAGVPVDDSEGLLLERLVAPPVVSSVVAQLPQLEPKVKDEYAETGLTEVTPEEKAKDSYQKSVEDLRGLPPTSLYNQPPPENLAIASDLRKPERTMEQVVIDFAWLDSPPEVSNPSVGKIIEGMVKLYKDQNVNYAEKGRRLEEMQSDAFRINAANMETILKEGKVLPSTRELMALESSVSGDFFRSMAGAGTQIMAMGNAILAGVEGMIPYLPKVSEEWLAKNTRSLAEQTANISAEVIKHGGLPAGVSQAVGEQALLMAVRLSALGEAGLMGSPSLIANSVKLGLITAATTPGSLKERTLTAVRSVVLMSTPLVSGMIPSRTLGIIADAALNTGLSHLLGFYDWKERDWTKIIPTLIMDVAFAASTRPGDGKFDRQLFKNLPQATKAAFKSWFDTMGLARATKVAYETARERGETHEDSMALIREMVGLSAVLADRIITPEIKLGGDTSAREAEIAAQNKAAGISGTRPAQKAPSADSIPLRAAVIDAQGRMVTGKNHAQALMNAHKQFKGYEAIEMGAELPDGKFVNRKEAAEFIGLPKGTEWQSGDIGPKAIDRVLTQAEAEKIAGVDSGGNPLHGNLVRFVATKSLEGIRKATIDEVNNLAKSTGVEVVATRATEPLKIRLGLEPKLNALIESKQKIPDRYNETTGQIDVGYRDPATGATYYKERDVKGEFNRWDVEVGGLVDSITQPLVGRNRLGRFTAIRPMEQPFVDKPRFVHGEKTDKATLISRLPDLPEIKSLSKSQQKLLYDAIGKYEGSVGELSPEKLGELIRKSKATIPLKSEEVLMRMEEKSLNSYIVGILYRGVKEGKGGYLEDIATIFPDKKATGLTFKKDKSGNVIGEGLSREEKLALAQYATQHYAERLPAVDSAKEFKANIGLVKVLHDAINDIKGFNVFLPRGSGITQQDRVVLKKHLRDSTKRSDPEGKYTDDFIDRIEFPLPTDADSLKNRLNMYQRELNGRIKALKAIENPNTRGIAQALYDGLRQYNSRNLAYDKLSRDTGNHLLFAMDIRRQNERKAAYAKGNRLIDDVFKKAGVSPDIASYTANSPDLERAVKLVMGVDPHTRNADLLEARIAAEHLINRDARGKEILKLAEGFRELLGGESAINVRIGKTMEFGAKWDNVKRTYASLSALSERTPRQQRKLNGIIKTIDDILPMRFNPETGKGELVPITDMEKAWGVYKNRDDNLTRKFMGEQDWGTRDYYYMSTKNRDIDTIIKPHDLAEVPSLESPKLATAVEPSGRLEHRLGIPEFAEGSPWSAIRRHVSSLYVQAYALESSRYVAKATDDAANEGYISKDTAKSLNDALKTDLGQVSGEVSKIARQFYTISRSWWTAFGLIPAKMAWYTARNVLWQGVPWGAMAGQYRLDDITKTQLLLSKEWINPNSAAKRHYAEDFKDRVAQGQAIYYEGFLQFAHNERTRAANKYVGKMQEFSSKLFSVSDHWNRAYTMFTGDVIIDRYLDRFISKGITESQLFHGLKLDALPEGHARYLSDLFSTAVFKEVDASGKPVLRKENFYEFMKQTSEAKTLFANFAYGTTERSSLEQNINTRFLWGIPVYPRGTFEVINETVTRPLVDAWVGYKNSGFKLEKVDWKAARTAVGNLAAQLLGRALSDLLLGKLIGEKEKFSLASVKIAKGMKKKTEAAFGIAEGIFSYSLIGPGGSELIKMAAQAANIAKAIGTGDTKEALAGWDKLGDSAMYYSVVIPSVVPLLEAAGDKQGLKNLDVIRSVMEGRIIGGKWRERDAYAALMHAIFDTEPMNRNDPLIGSYNIAREFLGMESVKEFIEPR